MASCIPVLDVDLVRSTSTLSWLAIGFLFSLSSIQCQDPIISLDSLNGDASCIINDKIKVVAVATADFSVADISWTKEVQFGLVSGAICAVAIDSTKCSASSVEKCYCREVNNEVYTVVMNQTAEKGLAGSAVSLVAVKGISTISSNSINYPPVVDQVTETIEFDGMQQGISTIINGSGVTINTVINYTVSGLSTPYNLLSGKESSMVLSSLNTNTVTIKMNSSTEKTCVGYLEASTDCQRNNLYCFSQDSPTTEAEKTCSWSEWSTPLLFICMLLEIAGCVTGIVLYFVKAYSYIVYDVVAVAAVVVVKVIMWSYQEVDDGLADCTNIFVLIGTISVAFTLVLIVYVLYQNTFNDSKSSFYILIAAAVVMVLASMLGAIIVLASGSGSSDWRIVHLIVAIIMVIILIVGIVLKGVKTGDNNKPEEGMAMSMQPIKVTVGSNSTVRDLKNEVLRQSKVQGIEKATWQYKENGGEKRDVKDTNQLSELAGKSPQSDSFDVTLDISKNHVLITDIASHQPYDNIDNRNNGGQPNA